MNHPKPTDHRVATPALSLPATPEPATLVQVGPPPVQASDARPVRISASERASIPPVELPIEMGLAGITKSFQMKTHAALGVANITHFSKLNVNDSLAHVAEAYLIWILGGKAPSGARRNIGVPNDWTMERLMAEKEVDLVGEKGMRLSIRRTDELFLLRWSHPDAEQGSVEWTTIVRAKTREEGGVKVEHGVAREPARNSFDRSTRFTVGATPKVLQPWLADHKGKASWEVFKDIARTISSENVRSFVRDILLDPTREMPVVVVSHTSDGHVPVVDPDGLSNLLKGVAPVFQQDSKATSFAFTRALEESGFEGRFSVYDGGVRIYRPLMSPQDDLRSHSLWLRTGLERIPDYRDRARAVADDAIRLSNALRVPEEFASLIEAFDAEMARARSKSALEAIREVSATEVVQAPEQTALVGALTEEVEVLRESLARAQAELRASQSLQLQMVEMQTEVRTLENLLAEGDSERQQLHDELKAKGARASEAEAKADGLEAQLKALRGNAGSPMASKEVKALLDGMLEHDWSPMERVLHLVEARYPDRVKVLKSAYQSAHESQFENPGKAMDLLKLLAVDYYDAVKSGGGDAKAREVFPKDRVSFRESETVMGSEVARRERTFTEDGKTYVLYPHIRVGNADNATKTLRIHFDWDGDRIVIGHAGRHLNFS